MSHQLADYRFELPQELIASRPAERRRDARMMVVNRAARTWEHRPFTDFAGYVRDGDLVVLNNSRVIRARLFPERPVEEILLLEPLGEELGDVGLSVAISDADHHSRRPLEFDFAITRIANQSQSRCPLVAALGNGLKSGA